VDGTNGSWDRSKREGDRWEVCGHALRDAQGQVVGRACITVNALSVYSMETVGVITVGGIRAVAMANIGGILIGTVETAARDTATPVVEGNELARWASEQSELVYKSFEGQLARLHGCAQIIRRCRGDVGNLPIARGTQGWLSTRQIQQWPNLPDELLLASDFEYKWEMLNEFVLNDNVLMVTTSSPSIVSQGNRFRPDSWPAFENRKDRFETIVLGAVVEALAKAWSSSTEDLVRSSDLNTSSQLPQRVIGLGNGQPITERVYVVRKP